MITQTMAEIVAGSLTLSNGYEYIYFFIHMFLFSKYSRNDLGIFFLLYCIMLLSVNILGRSIWKISHFDRCL